MSDITTISPQELASRQASDDSLELIDVRTPAEFQEVHVTYARNVPLDRLDPQDLLSSRGDGTSKPLYVICKSGARGKMACEKFVKAGFPDVINIEGGTEASAAAGLPVVRGKKVMSLERQVRIAAGSLVVLGVALGWFVHPGFLGLAGFVGAGLVFAGITDTCGMGMLISRMPWNQTSPETSCNVS